LGECEDGASDAFEEVVTLQGWIVSVLPVQSIVIGRDKLTYWSTRACVCASPSIRHLEVAFPARFGGVHFGLMGSEHVFICYMSRSMETFLGSLEVDRNIFKLRDDARERSKALAVASCPFD
jgi:hypothetical protein